MIWRRKYTRNFISKHITFAEWTPITFKIILSRIKSLGTTSEVTLSSKKNHWNRFNFDGELCRMTKNRVKFDFLLLEIDRKHTDALYLGRDTTIFSNCSSVNRDCKQRNYVILSSNLIYVWDVTLKTWIFLLLISLVTMKIHAGT